MDISPARHTDPKSEAQPGSELQPIERGYIGVLRINTALVAGGALLMAIIAAIALEPAVDARIYGVPALVFALSVLALTSLPERRWQRWGYAMRDTQLRIVRGWLFRTDTIVPYNRMQHIDIAQGPIERLCGVSSLVVHTAGTHNSTVSLPGLSPADAAAMRDTIRAHIRHERV